MNKMETNKFQQLLCELKNVPKIHTSNRNHMDEKGCNLILVLTTDISRVQLIKFAFKNECFIACVCAGTVFEKNISSKNILLISL